MAPLEFHALFLSHGFSVACISCCKVLVHLVFVEVSLPLPPLFSCSLLTYISFISLDFPAVVPPPSLRVRETKMASSDGSDGVGRRCWRRRIGTLFDPNEGAQDRYGIACVGNWRSLMGVCFCLSVQKGGGGERWEIAEGASRDGEYHRNRDAAGGSGRTFDSLTTDININIKIRQETERRNMRGSWLLPPSPLIPLRMPGWRSFSGGGEHFQVVRALSPGHEFRR